MKKAHVTLTAEDETTLAQMLKKGQLPARVYRRAVALLELNRGKTITAVAKTIGVTANTLTALKKNYAEVGLGCLEDAPRSGRPIEINGAQRAKITALACSDAPEGYTRWALRLLADKVVELGDCEHVSHTHVGNILKKT